MIRAVVFDLYGTLIDNYGYGSEAIVYRDMNRRVAEALGIEVHAYNALRSGQYLPWTTGLFPTFAHALDEGMRGLGLELSAEQIAAAAEIRVSFMHALPARRDAVETLTALRATGIKTAVISNCGPDTAIRWAEIELGPQIDSAVLSCEIGLAKPDPEIFLAACRRLAVDPADCLYVADGENGELAAAGALGMHPVLIRSSYRDPPFFRQPHVEPWDGPEVAFLHDVLELVR